MGETEDAHATTQKKATHDIFNVLGVSEPFEFTDTDGDTNRLEMIDQEMYWSAPDGIGAWIRRGQCGRCTFQKSSGQITCENAEATLKEEDIEEFISCSACRYRGQGLQCECRAGIHRCRDAGDRRITRRLSRHFEIFGAFRQLGRNGPLF